MRHFLQIYFGLFIPLTGLFIAITTGYYMIDYSFSKAIKLAILAGVVGGLSVSFFSAILILVMRAGSQPKINIKKKEKKKQKETIVNKTSVKEKIIEDTTPMSNFITHHFMLLMDKTLAFEISKHAIASQKMHKQGHHENFEDGLISIKTINEFIKINISSLTKHTVKVSMEYKRNSLHAPVILEFLKEKEVSFLDYK